MSVIRAQQERIEALEAAEAESRSLAKRIESLEQMLQQLTVMAKETRSPVTVPYMDSTAPVAPGRDYPNAGGKNHGKNHSHPIGRPLD